MNRYELALGKKPPKIWDEMTSQEHADLFNAILDHEIKPRYPCRHGGACINPTQIFDCASCDRRPLK